MLMDGIFLISSVILGSSLANAFTGFILGKINLGLYNTSIPGVTQELVQQKSFDLVNFALALGLSVVIFVLVSKLIKTRNNLLGLALLIFSSLIFIQTHFGTYSMANTVMFVAIFIIGISFLSRGKNLIKNINQIPEDKRLLVLANGLLAGFYILLVINQFTTTILPLLALIVAPLFYFLFYSKIKKFAQSNLHLFFIICIVNPASIWFLIFVGASFIALIKRYGNIPRNINELYPVAFVVLAFYNPTYIIGHFDSVEEGFWFGWLEGISRGKVLYRDLASYYPPLLVWTEFWFQKLVGFSIGNTRLFLHVLQVSALVIYYFAADRILKLKVNKFVVMLIILGLVSTQVRNNVEIRTAVGLLSLISLSIYFQKKSTIYVYLAGALASVALLTSIEVGVAASVATLLALAIFSKKRTGAVLWYLTGLLSVLLPVLIYFSSKGALTNAISQMGFYANAFSSGYFNAAVERTSNLNFIQWFEINKYLSNNMVLWEVAQDGAIGALIYSFYRYIKNKNSSINKTVFMYASFSILVFRAALGRSDYYHLLFPLLIIIPLIFYVVENISYNYKKNILNYAVAFGFILVFTRININQYYLDGLLFRLQTYGQVLGNYHKFADGRGGVLIIENPSTKAYEQMLSYIKANTNEEDKIFTYPWSPETYFLTNRLNATKISTPYAFFSDKYQNEMINDLKTNKPKFVIYNPDMNFGDLSPDSLPLINNYILQNYKELREFGANKILIPVES